MRNSPSSCYALLSIFLSGFVLCATAHAAIYTANPSNYTSVAAGLQPGDTLNLVAGTYTGDLSVTGLNGSASAWITIQGPATGSPAFFVANSSANTVELYNCSFLAIKNLTLDGQNLAGPFGVSAKGGTANLTHDILIEGCTIQNYNGSQQTDGISTKTPTWNWTIRRNTIINAGTGLYLGNSDGSDPFVAGVIEDNLVEFPIGYCMEIKFQLAWPSVPGMPTGPTTTIIRNNVFIKNDAPSPDGDRPNLLVGGFPASGPGSANRYEVYGNLFDHNPRESLFQFSGRVTVHDNVFVDVVGKAIAAQNQDEPLELAYIYNNTIYAVGTGISFANAASQGDGVTGNLIFATTPIAGPIANLGNNLTDTVANASAYVTAPSTTLGSMNFYPLSGQCTGSALNMSAFTSDTDYSIDFNGVGKGSFTYRGAYAGSGSNPGWQLQAGIKTLGTTPQPPVITSSLSASGSVGSAFSYTIKATNTPANFNASGLPGGLTVGTGSGIISGTPSVAGTFNVTISATNSAGTGSAILVLTINPAQTPSPPVITSAASATPNPVTFGQSTTLMVAASNSANKLMTYSWNFGDGTTGSVASVPHTYSSAGTFTATVTVTDADGSATSSVTVTVNPVNVVPKTLHVAGIAMSLSTTSMGKAANATVTVKDGNGAVVSGVAVSGTWSSLTSASVLGTTSSAGTIKFTSARTKKTGTFTFTVTNVAKSGYTYAVSQNTASSESISTSGVVSKIAAAAADVAAADVVPLGSVTAGKTFKLALPLPPDIPQKGAHAAGKLPDGLRVSGLFIGGKPKATGTFTFTVQFKVKIASLDANGKRTTETIQTEQEYTIEVTQ
jgi:PKD repeat protein